MADSSLHDKLDVLYSVWLTPTPSSPPSAFEVFAVFFARDLHGVSAEHAPRSTRRPVWARAVVRRKQGPRDFVGRNPRSASNHVTDRFSQRRASSRRVAVEIAQPASSSAARRRRRPRRTANAELSPRPSSPASTTIGLNRRVQSCTAAVVPSSGGQVGM
ncbi:hypothetical protein F4820DRAFT_398526 [Hypoxylon rubiginosum]|uniref:Uncharacterized protein n=1 Tax=Hypoxylon rubiginosum TaxID=110542 RepID=A0ACB9YUW0_9PEZI|nr:hypothetical protein F4820DRAFT_398526 [Hypoxylon rubiginosum]